MNVQDWVEQLYGQACGVIAELEHDVSLYYAHNGIVPIIDPETSDILLPRFDQVMRPVRGLKERFDRGEYSDVELDIISGFFNKRLQEISASVHQIHDCGGDSDSLTDTLWPNFLTVISLVSIVGALNSDRGIGRCGDNAMTQLFYTNEDIIVGAFCRTDRTAPDFLDRTHKSDLSAFGGVLLARTLHIEALAFEFRKGDSRMRPNGINAGDVFPAETLREILQYEQQLPQDFWEVYFDAVYDPDANIPNDALMLPGSYRWAHEAGVMDIYAELAQRDSRFFEQLKKHMGIPELSFASVFPDYIPRSGPGHSVN